MNECNIIRYIGNLINFFKFVNNCYQLDISPLRNFCQPKEPAKSIYEYKHNLRYILENSSYYFRRNSTTCVIPIWS